MKLVLQFFLASLMALVSAFASAAGPNMDSLTGAIDFTTVIAAILAVSALIVGVAMAVRGVKYVIGIVKGA